MAEGSTFVTSECLEELLGFFASHGYKASSNEKNFQIVEKMSLHLLARDYLIETVDNSDGHLCPHYPTHLMIIARRGDDKTIINNAGRLKEFFKVSKLARSLSRFPVPVILIGNKNICRSSTLSTAMELYGRSGLDWMFSGRGKGGGGGKEPEEVLQPKEKRLSEWALVDQSREFDSQLISALGVTLICDLMVEMRKTQYGLTLTSSEKADGKLWYSNFTIASLPYPGCEFFVRYRQNKESIATIRYDWSMPMNDAVINVPTPLPESVGIDFTKYKSWNIIQHTQNYLKLLLHYLQYEEGGVLIHCVAGWDRTPLYISLLRLSLWADGHIHESLCPSEMLYLTLAYDWFMFGHKFEERLRKVEEVLYFCFDFLQHITSDEFAFKLTPPTTPPTSNNDSTCNREEQLTKVRDLFLKVYDSAIPLTPHSESPRGVGRAGEVITGMWGRVTSYFPSPGSTNV